MYFFKKNILWYLWQDTSGKAQESSGQGVAGVGEGAGAEMSKMRDEGG